MAAVGVRELKAKLSHFVDRASTGEALIVTQHGKPVAVLAPLPEGMRAMEQLRRRGLVQWAGGKPSVPGPACQLDQPHVSHAVVAARGR
ncbi:MAG: type II toxin-antitoxin system Phd/YefM family antitoxin [Vicinamibacterales bacterium]